MCKPGKKCDDKKLDKLLEDEADNNIIQAQIIIKINGPEGSIHFYEPQIGKIGRGLDDPQVGMPKNIRNILQESLNLNGSKDGKIEKLSFASQIGRKSNNTGVCKYGENANGKNFNILLQDKVHRKFIHPRLIGNLNGSPGGRQFDEMQSDKVGRFSYDLQLCMPLNVSIT